MSSIAITGANRFGVRARLDALISAFVKVHGNLAIEKLDGNEISYNQILGAIESLPFLANKKMVIVYDLSSNKQAAESLEAIIKNTAETTDLIIVESKLDKRNSYYKSLKKLTDFQEFNDLDESQLTYWLMAEAEKRQAELGRNEARYLVERVGPDQTRLSQELEKLVTYSPKISRSSIDLLVDESPSSTIFNLIDSAFSGNLNVALDLYEEQRLQRIEPQAIHAMLVWQMHVVTLVSAAPEGLSAQKIAHDSGMNPFVVQKSQHIANKMDRAMISKFTRLLRDIDFASKSETIDYDEALRFAIVSLARA